MMQVLKTTRSYSFTAADTSAHVFAATPARQVVFQPPSGNTGSVTILGVSGGTADSAGIVLTKGTISPVFWVNDLSQLAFQLATANDTVTALVSL